MKKVKVIFLFFLIFLVTMTILAGCYSEKVNANEDSMFTVVEKVFGCEVIIAYHNQTKVMYAISSGLYNKGNVTLLVDEFGNPLIWHERK